jgi:hypothetical protein
MSTIEYERLADGRLAAWVFTVADRVLLRRCGEVIAHDFGGEAFERFDAMDQVFWDFLVAGQRVTLRLVDERGIAVESGEAGARNDELVRRIAERLGALEPGAAKP